MCSCGHHHHDHDDDDDDDEDEHERDVIELQPAVGTAVHDALGAQDHAVLAAVQLGQCMLDVCLAELLGRLDTPAGEHLIGIEVRQRGADVGGKLVVIGSKLDEKAIAALFGC